MIGIGTQRSALEISRLTRWDGEKKVARALVVFAALSVLAMLFVPWQQNASGSGQVVAWSPNERELVVQAPIDGRVATWRHREGDSVDAGEILVELRDNDPNVIERYESQRDALKTRVGAARGSIEALRDQLEATERMRALMLDSADSKVRMAENERDAAELSLEAAAAKERAAESQLRRVDNLEDDGLNSERDLDIAQRNAAQAGAAVLAAKAALEAAKSRVAAERASREGKASEFDAKLASIREGLESARGKQSKASKSLAGAERALARQRSLEVRAPRSGMLTRVLAREGSAYVKQGDVLAVVVPSAEERAVELFINGNDSPLVVEGQDVRLQFEGWPAIQLGGWPEAAVGTFSGEVAFVEAHATRKGRFRVLVRPARGADWPSKDVLRQGNAATGWILLEQVALGYELWRQLNGFPADLPAEAARAAGYRPKP